MAANSRPKEKPEATVINVSLTDTEKAGGILTPEILWKYGRIGSIVLSPDGKTVLYTVTNYDLPTEARTTNIYSIPSSGGTPVQLTTDRRIWSAVDRQRIKDRIPDRRENNDHEA